MAKRDWELISEVTSALGRANTPRTTPRAIGEALSERWDARAVRLCLATESMARVIEATRVDGRWTTVQSERPRRRSDTSTAKPSFEVSESGATLHLPIDLGGEDGELRIRFGAGDELLAEPTYLSTLTRIVQTALGHQQLIQRVADLSRSAHAENIRLRKSLARVNLVARSSQMRDVVKRVVMVAGYDTPVLVQGESGVGKELISREIHRRSSRCRRPFVQLNCGAIPNQLVESELFGHERGAFTGADRARRGVFEQADGGVLMLDEVGDLPLDAQVKLLRALQEGRVRRVGAESELSVDVRVVAATNRNLESMVQSGAFRDDLFYRLNVFPIHIPALRERPEDIVPLIRDLVQELSERLGTKKPTIPRAALSRLQAHSWPGNIRELSNVLEASLILGGGKSLELPPDFDARGALRRDRPNVVQPLDISIRTAIENALRSTRGKIYGPDGAAAALALHPATLQSKMRKLGVRRSDFVGEEERRIR